MTGSVSIAGTQRAACCRLGRAYRAGRLVCGWVQVTISDDGRLGLTWQERRVVRHTLGDHGYVVMRLDGADDRAAAPSVTVSPDEQDEFCSRLVSVILSSGCWCYGPFSDPLLGVISTQVARWSMGLRQVIS